jgi:PTH1 family peptidyl-tRNA hydrolase
VDHFHAAEEFAKPVKKLESLYADRELYGEKTALVKPQTYMNHSGRAVRAIVRYFAASALEPEATAVAGLREPADLSRQLLVIFDDLDLPLGKLRFRDRGSSGGHRGVASVIEALGTDRFSRLRVGIGREVGTEAADYVLETVGGDDEERLLEAAAHAAKTLPAWLQEGVEACANRFNGPGGELK